MTIIEIGKLAEQFAAAHQELTALGTAIDLAAAQLRLEFGGRYRKLSARLSDRHCALAEAIKASPELWERPRTQVLSGIKVGLAKGPGGIQYGDPADVVRRIRRMFPDDAERFLHIKECPRKEALDTLTVNQLEKLGCAVVNASDQVVIKPVTGEMSKFAADLLKKLAAESRED